MRRPLLVALLVVAAAPAASSAAVVNRTFSAGDNAVQATLTLRGTTDRYGKLTASNLRLQIARAGATVYDKAVVSRSCSPVCNIQGSSPLSVADIEANGQPDVLVNLYTGGAHCCSVLQVFAYDPASATYRAHEHNFFDAGERLTAVGGNGLPRLFESADTRFAYEFGSFAYSGLPIQVWRFTGGRFVDVTRAFPKAVAADATRSYRQYTLNRRAKLGLGFIAAWAADEYLLGHRAQVAATLARELRLGNLRSADRIWPGGGAFIAKLYRFLRHEGYR